MQPRLRINHQITAAEVRVLNEEGEQIAIMSLSKALALGQEHNLDVIEIAATAKPPVVKLMGYDKFRYQQKKIAQQQKKKSKKVEVKTIRLSPRTGEHDMATKAKQAKGFLEEGNLIKIELRMRGREQAHADIAEAQVKQFRSMLGEDIKVDVPLRRMGNTMSMTISPAK